MKHLLLTGLCCFPLFAGSLFAEEWRELEFTVYGQYPVHAVAYSPLSPAAVAAGSTQAEPVSIETHFLARSGPYPFKGGDQLVFKDTLTGYTAAEVTLPQTSDQWLLIFIKNPNYQRNEPANPKFFIYPFDDSQSHLAVNSLIFLNVSGKELQGLLGEQRVTLLPGESASYPVRESLRIRLWTSVFDGQKRLPAFIKTYQFNQGHRHLMIFFPPVLRGSVDLDVRYLSQALE